MRRFIKLLVSTLIVLSVITSSLSGILCFAASTNMYFNANTVNVGDTFTVTLTITADSGKQIIATGANLSYNSQVLSYQSVSGALANASNGSVKLSTLSNGENSSTFSVSFTAIAEGSSTISFSDVVYTPSDSDDEFNVSGQSATVNVIVPGPSSNASLSSLKVSGATLSPAFKPGTTKYTARVKHKTEKVTISGNAADGGTCEGFGTFDVKVGENVRYITVTAADGATKKTYTVNIIRNAEGEDEEDILEALTVTIGESEHTIVQDAPETAPAGFEISTATFNNREVSVLKSADEKIIIYTLTNNDTKTNDYYTYDEESNQFTLLKYAVLNGKMFVFPENEEVGVAEGYKKTELELGNSVIEAYTPTDKKLSDFYIVYCYVEGTYGYYSYDALEATIQRAPAFKLVEEKPVEKEEKEVISSFKDIFKLNGKAKAIIIVLIVIVLCIIALVVLIIVRFVKMRKIKEDDYESDFYEEDSIFDQVTIEDNSDNNNIIM